MSEPERPSTGQLTSLAISRNARYPKRSDWFDWVESEIGRRIGSNTKLTKIEAHHLITLLKG